MRRRRVNLGDVTGRKHYGRYRWALHLLLWVTYTFAYACIYSILYTSVDLKGALFQFGMTAWIDVGAAYFTVYFLIPEYLMQRRYKMFLLYFVLSALFFMLLQRSTIVFVTYPVLYPGENTGPFFRFNYIYIFFNIYVMAAIFASIKLFEYWFVDQKENRELQQQKLESELKFLKSQIHPHFLFNTLNNLYALTLDKSDRAPEVVVKLSDLLSYMLYECNVPRVPLEKEIQLLKDYLDLEKIRYPRGLKVNLEVQGRINGKMIAPLLLIPFVENGFKHGMSRQIGNPRMNILLDVKDYSLIFKIQNTKPAAGQNDETGYTEGIGLKNVRRRLDLIYGEAYDLKLNNAEHTFSVTLKLNLNSRTNITG
ncbi:MAG: sensor histidine kinase [Bacteroidales bacterium]